MKLAKYTIWAVAAAIAVLAAVPAQATWNSDNRGSVRGWSSSGWGSSGKPSSSGASTSSTSSSSSTGGTGSSSGGTPVPEPSNLLMLGLGLVGLIGGRMVARRRKKV